VNAKKSTAGADDSRERLVGKRTMFSFNPGNPCWQPLLGYFPLIF
jgi:hypothetical protein